MRRITSLAATTLLVYSGWAGAEDKAPSGKGLELVLNGRPISVIVVPRKALPVVRFAAKEIQHHVKASTEAILRIPVRPCEAGTKRCGTDCRRLHKTGVHRRRFVTQGVKLVVNRPRPDRKQLLVPEHPWESLLVGHGLRRRRRNMPN